MKRALLGIAVLILFSDFRVYAAGVVDNYPTLDAQIRNSIYGTINEKEAREQLEAYYKADDPEFRRGMTLVLQEDLYRDAPGPNYALHLLLHLARKKCHIPRDTMTFALALANNYIYSIADDETRAEIKKDIVAHFNFYRKVLAWQKTLNVRYDSSKVPVIPKIYWAYRVRGMDMPKKKEKLGLDAYREFVDRVESLEKMHEFVKKLNLGDVQSFARISGIVESFLHDRLTYRASIELHRRRLKKDPGDKNSIEAIAEYDRGGYEQEYRGKKRRWYGFYWLNYQLGRLEKEGSFKGDCMTATTIQMNMYKAMGVPALAEQIWSVNPDFYHHNSPKFYDVFSNAWFSIQKPVADPQGYYNYFTKPVYHHRLYELHGKNLRREGKLREYNNYWPGELATYDQVMGLRLRGFQEEHFERMFLSNRTQESGFIFNSVSAPAKLVDSDGDGIPDEFERARGTDPGHPDTDGDGYADRWEIEHGYDPADAGSPADKNIPAIDGLAAKYIGLNSLPSAFSPRGDSFADAEIYDVRSLSARLAGENLYVAATFYNDVSGNRRDVHTLAITARGREHRRYFLQWVDGMCHIYDVIENNGKEELVRRDNRPWAVRRLRDAEFLVPLSFFAGAEVLFITYKATGLKNGKATNSADVSKTLRVSLKGDEFASSLAEAMKSASGVSDPQGDSAGAKNVYDVRAFKAGRLKGRIVCYVDYYNDIASLKMVTHTIDIRDAKDKNIRWMVQTHRLDSCNLWKEKTRRDMNDAEFEIIPLDNAFLFIIDGAIFGSSPLKIRYRAGADDAQGKGMVNGDVTEYFELK